MQGPAPNDSPLAEHPEVTGASNCPDRSTAERIAPPAPGGQSASGAACGPQERAWPLSPSAVRSLVNLQETGSTSRVLNLPSVWRRHHETRDYWENPLFQHPTLNRAFLIKHTLRDTELGLFPCQRQSATKLLVPIDPANLRLGGRYLFLGQKGYEGQLNDLLGGDAQAHRRDRELLAVLDQIPSLDPFLMREQLRRHGIEAARCYFEVSEGDMKRMFGFVRSEIKPLVTIAFGDAEGEANVTSFVTKLLSSPVDSELHTLQRTLGIDDREFEEGMFCWKGFLYYKWTLAETMPGVHHVLKQLATMEPEGQPGSDELALLARARAHLKRSIGLAAGTVRETVGVYDGAYAKLTRLGRPLAFREFLLEAPLLFETLGRSLSALNHIQSFWGFRFPDGDVPKATVEELLTILSDFQAGLGGPVSRSPGV